MEKYLIESKEKWREWKKKNKKEGHYPVDPSIILYNGIDKTRLKKPSSFPCILIIGRTYSSHDIGWHENDFIYLSDFE
jgi:hypothetical protein